MSGESTMAKCRRAAIGCIRRQRSDDGSAVLASGAGEAAGIEPLWASFSNAATSHAFRLQVFEIAAASADWPVLSSSRECLRLVPGSGEMLETRSIVAAGVRLRPSRCVRALAS